MLERHPAPLELLEVLPYPQSNGKLERWHKTLKEDCIRPGTLVSLDDAKALIGRWIEHYNNVRLHSAIGYITPLDKLQGRQLWPQTRARASSLKVLFR